MRYLGIVFFIIINLNGNSKLENLYSKVKSISNEEITNKEIQKDSISSIEYKGIAQLEYKNTKNKIPFLNNDRQKRILVSIEAKKQFSNSLFFAKIEALKDFENINSKYIKINELYYKYESDNYDIKIGKDIKYWGALELHNLSDVYNEKNIENDPYDKTKKLGTDAFTYSYYTQDENSIELIVAKDKTQNRNISAYIKYSGSKNDVAQRDFSYILNTKDEKFITYHTLVNQNNIYKLEYLYTNKYKKYQAGLGIEHTFYNIFKKNDLALLIEYYKSNSISSNYKNNIFLASRFNINNLLNTTITFGIIKDNNIDKYSYTLEYESRINDYFSTKFNYLKNDYFDQYTINLSYNF